MNYNTVRKIPIAYLKAAEHEKRIYREKSIDTSVCDVMAAGDRLTGNAIKSDSDSCFGLDCQIKTYDRFFDKNCFAVSRSHCKSIQDHTLCFNADKGIPAEKIVESLQISNKYV